MTPWTVACQAPLFMGFPRQQYWSGLPFPSPEALPEPRMEPTSSWLADSLPLSHQGSPMNWFLKSLQTFLHFPSFSLQWLHPFCAWKTPLPSYHRPWDMGLQILLHWLLCLLSASLFFSERPSLVSLARLSLIPLSYCSHLIISETCHFSFLNKSSQIHIA